MTAPYFHPKIAEHSKRYTHLTVTSLLHTRKKIEDKSMALSNLNGRHFTVHHHKLTNLYYHLQNSFHLLTLTSPINFINNAISYDKTIFDSHTHFSDILTLTDISNLFPNHLHFNSTGTKTIIHHLTYTTGYKTNN